MAFSIRSFFGKQSRDGDAPGKSGTLESNLPNAGPAPEGAYANSLLFKTLNPSEALGQPVNATFQSPFTPQGGPHGGGLTVSDILPQLPADVVRAAQIPPGQPLQLPDEVIQQALRSGQASVPLFEVYRVCPALFQTPVSPQDPRQVPLPQHKMAQLLGQGGPQPGAAPMPPIQEALSGSPFSMGNPFQTMSPTAPPSPTPAAPAESPSLFAASPFAMATPPANSAPSGPPPLSPFANASPFGTPPAAQPNAFGSPFASAPASPAPMEAMPAAPFSAAGSPFASAPQPTSPFGAQAPQPASPFGAQSPPPASPFGTSPFAVPPQPPEAPAASPFAKLEASPASPPPFSPDQKTQWQPPMQQSGAFGAPPSASSHEMPSPFGFKTAGPVPEFQAPAAPPTTPEPPQFASSPFGASPFAAASSAPSLPVDQNPLAIFGGVDLVPSPFGAPTAPTAAQPPASPFAAPASMEAAPASPFAAQPTAPSGPAPSPFGAPAPAAHEAAPQPPGFSPFGASPFAPAEPTPTPAPAQSPFGYATPQPIDPTPMQQAPPAFVMPPQSPAGQPFGSPASPFGQPIPEAPQSVPSPFAQREPEQPMAAPSPFAASPFGAAPAPSPQPPFDATAAQHMPAMLKESPFVQAGGPPAPPAQPAFTPNPFEATPPPAFESGAPSAFPPAPSAYAPAQPDASPLAEGSPNGAMPLPFQRILSIGKSQTAPAAAPETLPAAPYPFSHPTESLDLSPASSQLPPATSLLPPPQPPAPVPASVAPPAPPAATSDGDTLKMSLASAVKNCSAQELGINPELIPSWIQISLPLDAINRQMATGRVRVGLGTLMEGLEPGYRSVLANAHPGLEIDLPSSDFFHALPTPAAEAPAAVGFGKVIADIAPPQPEPQQPEYVQPMARPMAPAETYQPAPVQDYAPLPSPVQPTPSPSFQEQPAPEPALPEQVEATTAAPRDPHRDMMLRALLQSSADFDARSVIQHTAQQAGVHAVVCLLNGREVTSAGAATADAERFRHQAPQLLTHLQPIIAMTGIEGTETFSMKSDAHIVTFSFQGPATLCVLHDPYGADRGLPEKLTLISRELAKMLQESLPFA